MTKTPDRNLIVGLDIGTTKIAVLVGEVLPDGEINIVGLGTHAAKGMDKGGVNDLESVVKSLQRAVEEAEMMAQCHIFFFFFGIINLYNAFTGHQSHFFGRSATDDSHNHDGIILYIKLNTNTAKTTFEFAVYIRQISCRNIN